MPKLRFAEFQGMAGWPLEQLRNIASINKGEQLPASEKDNDALYPHFNGGTSPSSYTHKSNREANTIIVSEGGNSCGHVQFVGVPFWCGGHCYSLTPSSRVVTGCLYFALQARQSQIMALRVGSGLPNIQKSALERFLLALPPTVDEQQKIAECLGSLEAQIAAQGRKVETLKDHKKGLSQQLFPQEGETQPRLRFPEFKGAGDWIEVPLARFIEEFRSQSVVQDEFEVLTSARSGLVRQRDYYENDRIAERDNIGFNIIPEGYLTYRSRSDDRRFFFNENNLGITGIVSVYYPVFRILNGSNKFFIELLSAFSRVVGKYSVGTSQTVLSLNQLKKIKLPVTSAAEQRRIADCFVSLDDLIAAEIRKLDTLRTHKKGLLQQLFPLVDGVEE